MFLFAASPTYKNTTEYHFPFHEPDSLKKENPPHTNFTKSVDTQKMQNHDQYNLVKERQQMQKPMATILHVFIALFKASIGKRTVWQTLPQGIQCSIFFQVAFAGTH